MYVKQTFVAISSQSAATMASNFLDKQIASRTAFLHHISFS